MKTDRKNFRVLDFEIIGQQTEKEKTSDNLQQPKNECDERKTVAKENSWNGESDNIVFKQKGF